MRTRAFAATAVLAQLSLPLAIGAQVLPRLPRRGTPAPQSPPEPTAGPVARVLDFHRSRWSAESDVLASSILLPSASGGVTRYSTLGTGVHSDYRVTDQFSGTADMTFSPFGGTALATTAEVGGRYRASNLESEIRPFVDLRAAYLRMYDSYSAPLEAATVGAAGVPTEYATNARYSRGFGGIGGAGMELSVSRTVALTTEIAALRSRLTTYRSAGPAQLPAGSSLWMTTVRYAVGFRYNPGSFHSSNDPH
ncbi:MAG TPA: hypothetical protein VH277_14475 [Gemmatimonadaceae bacterium]|nr:hypothetical protein [Gemmatimonadaceae bacterium]